MSLSPWALCISECHSPFRVAVGHDTWLSLNLLPAIKIGQNHGINTEWQPRWMAESSFCHPLDLTRFCHGEKWCWPWFFNPSLVTQLKRISNRQEFLASSGERLWRILSVTWPCLYSAVPTAVLMTLVMQVWWWLYLEVNGGSRHSLEIC